MERILRRVGKFLSIFSPKRVHILLYKVYRASRTRTDELLEIINEKKPKNYLEVGVWHGDNLFPIAKKFPDLICYGVDSYSGSSFEKYYKGEIMALVDGQHYEKLFQEISNKTKDIKNIYILRMFSEEAAKDFEDESLDVVFIDARHDYESVAKDIKLWLPKVKMGGVLCGHDYSLNFFGVIEAVNELIGYDNVSIKSDATWFYTKR